MQILFGRMKAKYSWTILALLAFFPAMPASGYVVDRIAAVVNNDIILLSEVNKALTPYERQIRSRQYSPAQEEKMLYEVREQILDQMINQKLTDQVIAERGITVTDQEIEHSIERFKQANRLTDEQLRDKLASEGLTYDDYRQLARDQILRSRLVNMEVKSKIIITEEDVKQYYQRNKDQYSGQPAYHLRNIVVPVAPDAEEAERKTAFNRIQEAREKLLGEAPFAEVAKEYSDSFNAADGGDLGTFELMVLSPVLKEAIQQTDPGSFTDILETDQGYQIFYVEEVMSSSGKTLEEVSAEIEDKLYTEVVDEKFTTWIEDLRRQSYIKIIR